MSEYQKLSEKIAELQQQNATANRSLETLNRTLMRLLTWAEGDKNLGSPSVQQKIDANAKSITDLSKKVYQNEDRISQNKFTIDVNTEDLQNMKRQAGIIGAGSGGIIYAFIESIKQIFGL